MYVLMKILESSPKRYDRRIVLITLGRLNSAYDRLISYIGRGMKVLDIGCGTGLLTIRAAEKGAEVKGIDINPAMLEIAEKRLKSSRISEKLKENVEFCEMGTEELETENENSYDAVVSGLCFSELSRDEIRFTLKQLRRIIKPAGFLLIAVEAVPETTIKHFIYAFFRIPLLLVTYIFTGTITKPVKNLPLELKQAGFTLEDIRANRMGSFMELIARNSKPEKKT